MSEKRMMSPQYGVYYEVYYQIMKCIIMQIRGLKFFCPLVAVFISFGGGGII